MTLCKSKAGLKSYFCGRNNPCSESLDLVQIMPAVALAQRRTGGSATDAARPGSRANHGRARLPADTTVPGKRTESISFARIHFARIRSESTPNAMSRGFSRHELITWNLTKGIRNYFGTGETIKVCVKAATTGKRHCPMADSDEKRADLQVGNDV